ncbi:hypothetical protein [Salegentibacter sp. UBA1130]|uniref:hypothetical protein n=1 Tax=Salegentibacter sp. UBA1130 TaxID=1947451 RepID=UPI00257BF7A6|nr:hypothetical protein [Salegentibacter sp. UBA1130]
MDQKKIENAYNSLVKDLNHLDNSIMDHAVMSADLNENIEKVPTYLKRLMKEEELSPLQREFNNVLMEVLQKHMKLVHKHAEIMAALKQAKTNAEKKSSNLYPPNHPLN